MIFAFLIRLLNKNLIFNHKIVLDHRQVLYNNLRVNRGNYVFIDWARKSTDTGLHNLRMKSLHLSNLPITLMVLEENAVYIIVTSLWNTSLNVWQNNFLFTRYFIVVILEYIWFFILIFIFNLVIFLWFLIVKSALIIVFTYIFNFEAVKILVYCVLIFLFSLNVFSLLWTI